MNGNAYQAVSAALECGFRHIDTASIYKNHEDVGRFQGLSVKIMVPASKHSNVPFICGSLLLPPPLLTSVTLGQGYSR